MLCNLVLTVSALYCVQATQRLISDRVSVGCGCTTFNCKFLIYSDMPLLMCFEYLFHAFINSSFASQWALFGDADAVEKKFLALIYDSSILYTFASYSLILESILYSAWCCGKGYM